MSKGQNEMAKRVLLSTLNVGDKFTSDIKGGNFIITSKVGDRINIKDLDTGKETFFGSGSYMVEPISEEAPQQTYTFRQPEYMDDPEYGEKSAEEIYTESVSSRNHKFKPEELKVGKRVIDKVGGKEVHGKITVNHHDLYKDNPYTQDKKGSTVVTIVTDSGRSYDVDANDNGGEFILEGCKGKKKVKEDSDYQKERFEEPSYMEEDKMGLITDVKVGNKIKYMGKELKIIQKNTDFLRGMDKDGNVSTLYIAKINDPIVIKESRIAKGYENLNAEERAKHLLSHPTSKYMSDLKSENITERAIRKAVKEMLGKPDKRDPQFITDVNEGCGKVQESFLIVGKLPYDDLKQAYISYSDKGLDIHTPEYKKHATRFSSRQEAQKVLDLMKKEGWKIEKFEIVQEEGEAPAVANTTANVANPELPLKLKESVGQKLNITLIRKPQNMKEVESDMRAGHGDRVKAVVDKSYTLSKSEYEAFVYDFNRHTTYLSREGGVDPDGTVHVVEIKAPGMKTIYVDPEGYDYARYVGY